VIGLKPNPNWLPLTLYCGVPGPFTTKLAQFSSTLIGYYIKIAARGQMLSGFPCIPCYGRQQYHTLSYQTASDRYAKNTATEGHCFVPLDAFSGETLSGSCKLKDSSEIQRDKR
jgi:hypothetical protein